VHAARRLLGHAEPFAPVPYVWSDQYDRKIQTVGVVSTDSDMRVAHGTLEIKGKHHDLDVPFSLQGEGTNAIVFGTLTLNRLEYGIGSGEWSNTQWLGGEVKVAFRATLSAE